MKRLRQEGEAGALAWLNYGLQGYAGATIVLIVGLATGLAYDLILAFLLVLVLTGGCVVFAAGRLSVYQSMWPSLWLAMLVPLIAAGTTIGYLELGRPLQWWMLVFCLLGAIPTQASREVVQKHLRQYQ